MRTQLLASLLPTRYSVQVAELPKDTSYVDFAVWSYSADTLLGLVLEPEGRATNSATAKTGELQRWGEHLGWHTGEKSWTENYGWQPCVSMRIVFRSDPTQSLRDTVPSGAWHVRLTS